MLIAVLISDFWAKFKNVTMKPIVYTVYSTYYKKLYYSLNKQFTGINTLTNDSVFASRHSKWTFGATEL